MLITFEIWVTNFTEFTCGVCARLNGAVFEKGKGPHPPIHPRCRCRRKFHHQVWFPSALDADRNDPRKGKE